MEKTKKLTMAAMLAAIAYLVMFISHTFPPVMPSAPFISYDPKDIIIVIGGFILGPFYAFIISVIVALAEMFTVSTTGPIGFIMNVLGSAAFCCSASYIYSRKHTLKRAVIGLIVGTILLTAVMLLWNYILTPLYMAMPRETVAKMLLPVFLPVNLFKGGLNTAITLILYKPVVTALRRSGLLPKSENNKKPTINAGVIIFSAIILISCVLFLLVVRGII